MNFLNILLILVIVLGCVIAKAQSFSKISDSEKFQIIKSILSKEFRESKAKSICLSTENIPESMTRKLSDVEETKLMLAAPDKIGDLLGCGIENYHFSGFERKSSSILVYFYRNNSNFTFSGRRYCYRKVKGKWHSKIVGFTMGGS